MDMTKRKTAGYSLTDFERKVISQVSVDRRLYNDSAALRQIIFEWARANGISIQPVTDVSVLAAQTTLNQ